jgi:hypothetical protein
MNSRNLASRVANCIEMRKSVSILLLSISLSFLAKNAIAEQWILAGNGGRGSDPIVGGYRDYNHFYVCAGRTPNGFQSGHLAERQSKCYVAWGNKYIGFSSYYVLQGSKELRWINRNMADPNQVIKLDPEDGIPTLICRGSNGLPGKVVHGDLRNGVCYTSWGNNNTHFFDFEVLERIPLNR